MVFQGDFKLPSLKASLILGKLSMVFQFLKQQFDMEFSSLQKNIIHLPFPHCDSTSYSGLIRSKHFRAKGGRGFSAVSLGTFSFCFFFSSVEVKPSQTHQQKPFYVEHGLSRPPSSSGKSSREILPWSFFTVWKSWLFFRNFQCSTCSRKSWVGLQVAHFKKKLIPIQPSKSELNLSRINLLKHTTSSRQFHINIDTFHQTTNHPHHLSCVATDPPFFPRFSKSKKVVDVQRSLWMFLGIPESLNAMTSFTWDAARMRYPNALRVAFREKLQLDLPLKDVETSKSQVSHCDFADFPFSWWCLHLCHCVDDENHSKGERDDMFRFEMVSTSELQNQRLLPISLKNLCVQVEGQSKCSQSISTTEAMPQWISNKLPWIVTLFTSSWQVFILSPAWFHGCQTFIGTSASMTRSL